MPNVIETTDAAADASTAYSLAVGQTAQGNLSTSGDQDFFRVDLVAGRTYTFALVGTGASDHLVDPILGLLDAAGETLAISDDDGPGANAGLTFRATTSGTYYLAVASADEVSTGQYGLSITTGRQASYDEQMAAGVLLRPLISWSQPGTAANVTWAVQQTLNNITDAQGNPVEGVTLTAAQISAVQGIFERFSEVSNLSFTQINPGGTSDNATLRFAAYNSTTDGTGAYAYFPGDPSPSSLSGDVRFNNQSVSTTSLPFGTYSGFVIMHELGHALGITHPGDYNAAPGVSITYANSAQFRQDSQQYTIESYFNAGDTSGDYGGFPDTLMLFDILAMQQLYGVNTTTRTGATTYGFGSNAGAVYDFAINTDPLLCIWDAGGIDTINASGFGQNQKIDLNAGAFSNIGGRTGNVSIAFGAVIENATGGAGDDVLIGNAAANIMNGGAGADRMEGGLGDDTYYVDNAGDLVIEKSNGGTDTVISSVSFSLYGQNAEKLTLTGSSDIDATGNGLNNVIIGNSGSNLIDGGKGADRMEGGRGNDTYYVDNLGDVVIEGANRGNDTVIAAVSFSLAGQHIENLTLTGTGNTNATGNGLNNILIGNAGNNDLNGAAGDDVMTGGLGDDNYYVDSVGDTVVELVGQGHDTVYSSVTWQMGDAVEDLVLTGNDAISAFGNAMDNVITGNKAANVIDGQGGADVMSGGKGDDTYTVDNLGDWVIEKADGGNDTVYSAVNFSLVGQHIEVLIANTSADVVLVGNGLANYIQGGAGSDHITGGGGADGLTGNGGADVFIYAAVSDSTLAASDTIYDLSSDDILDLHLIDANTKVAGDQAFVRVDAFTHHAGEMVYAYDYNAGTMVLTADVNGDGVADFRVNIYGNDPSISGWIL